MAFDYDQLEAGYYDKVFRRCRGIQSKWHHQKFAHVREAMGPFASHLDIGCGPGTFIGTLEGPGRSIGVDISAPQIEYADAHYGSNLHGFQVVAPGRLPFPDESFDVVTVLELVEHLGEQDGVALLREAHRVLKGEGRLIVTTPNYEGLWPVLEMLVNRLGQVSYARQHVTHYNRRSLGRLLAGAGFEVVLLETHMLLAPFLAVLGWRLADLVEALEPNVLSRHIGHLLMAKGIKRCRSN
jgi:SAM-dependent methyltransferase